MTHTSTAQIIPFPMARIEQVGRERLARSLAKLQAAAAEQAVAVAAWRAQIERLRGGVAALGQSFEEYDARLGAVRLGVDAVGVEARALRDRADAAAEGR